MNAMMCVYFFFSSRRRHTRLRTVTGVQTCALPICRIRGAAKVETFVLDRGAEASVLRQPMLGDVHAGEHLHARDERGRDFTRQQRDVAERSVHAKADAEVILPRLEVNIARAFLRAAADD